MRNEFAKYTEKIRTLLPFWFKMKKQPQDSLGLQFLNVFGMQLDDVEKILNYAYEQTKITTIDEDFIDIVYKIILPSTFNMDNIKGVRGEGKSLAKVDDLYTFFGLEYNYKINDIIKQPDYYFVDYDKKIIYVRFPYNRNRNNVFGIVEVITEKEDIKFPLQIHHVWNFFDEFGALVGCTRLLGEKNREYKQRILDVFKNISNSTKIGLMNGISRELGLRQNVIWSDTSKDFILNDEMIIVNSIKLNNEFLDTDLVYVNAENKLVLKSKDCMVLTNLKQAEVSYVKGMELTSFADTSLKVLNELYNPDGTPTRLLLDYIGRIKKESSVLWGDFIYGEGIWVFDDDEFNTYHFSFVPAMFDGNFKGFANYGFAKKGGA